jgi:hypothetical protein
MQHSSSWSSSSPPSFSALSHSAIAMLVRDFWTCPTVASGMIASCS